MVIGHVLPEKNESLLEAYEKCRSAADSKTCCDYALHVGVTWWGPKVPAGSFRVFKVSQIGRIPLPLVFFWVGSNISVEGEHGQRSLLLLIQTNFS